MFTRYRGTEIPENYSGVRFRDFSPPPTEMKTHKPTPSYTSTKTSVSPTFRSAQLQRGTISSRDEQELDDVEAELDFNGGYLEKNNSFPLEGNELSYESSVQAPSERGDFSDFGCESCNEEKENEMSDSYTHKNSFEKTTENEALIKSEQKKEKGADFKGELGTLLDKILKGIQGEDFLLLAVIILILADGKSDAKGALLPLALLLLYS